VTAWFVDSAVTVAEVWRRSSVIRSWLLDLTAGALGADPGLEQFTGHVSDSGEGRWTSIAAIEEDVPPTLLTAALYSRFASRGSEPLRGQGPVRATAGVRRPRREGAVVTTEDPRVADTLVLFGWNAYGLA
jgi:6-phosphogluconate dehydrogenase (decarboxylating)